MERPSPLALRKRRPPSAPTEGRAPEAPELDPAGFERLAVRRTREFSPAVDAEALALVSSLMRVATELLSQLESGVHRPRGWSWAGYRIMFCVLVAGPLEPRRLAPLAGVTRAGISAVLNTLERDGLVERRRGSEDRRVVTITLTDAGRKAVIDGFGLQHEVEKAWARTLTRGEQKTFVRLLRKISENAPAAKADGGEPATADGGS